MQRIVPPSWLSKTGKMFFKKLGQLVTYQDDSQKEQLAILADAYATYRQAAEAIDRDGLTITSGAGTLRAHPAVRIKNEATRTILTLSKQLGLDKSDKVATDELDTFFN